MSGVAAARGPAYRRGREGNCPGCAAPHKFTAPQGVVTEFVAERTDRRRPTGHSKTEARVVPQHVGQGMARSPDRI